MNKILAVIILLSSASAFAQDSSNCTYTVRKLGNHGDLPSADMKELEGVLQDHGYRPAAEGEIPAYHFTASGGIWGCRFAQCGFESEMYANYSAYLYATDHGKIDFENKVFDVGSSHAVDPKPFFNFREHESNGPKADAMAARALIKSKNMTQLKMKLKIKSCPNS